MKCVILEMPKHFFFDIFSMKLFHFLFGNDSLQLEGGKVKQDLEVNGRNFISIQTKRGGVANSFFFFSCR